MSCSRTSGGGTRGDGVFVHAALHLLLDQSGLAQDAQVLGGVVMGEGKFLGNLTDAQRTGDQFPHDRKTRLVTQGFEPGHAFSLAGFFLRHFEILDNLGARSKHGRTKFRFYLNAG